MAQKKRPSPDDLLRIFTNTPKKQDEGITSLIHSSDPLRSEKRQATVQNMFSGEPENLPISTS